MRFIKFILPVTILITILLFPIKTSKSEEKISKKVYLTFDDGPTTNTTPLILDKLKELEIPATFFVVGKLIDENPEVLKRIINEKHSIGLHTMSHDKNKCYKSHESFIKENIELQNKIKQDFGITTNILRFPFGSKNSYLCLNKTFEEKLHKENFKIFDWHIDTLDALHPEYPPETLVNICYKQLEKRFKDHSDLVILMHTNSNNHNSIKALSGLKELFNSMGYEFDVLTDKNKELYNIN